MKQAENIPSTEKPTFSYFIRSGIITPDELLEIETALAEILAHGYGYLEITVERKSITGFRKTFSEKFDKFKQ